MFSNQELDSGLKFPLCTSAASLACASKRARRTRSRIASRTPQRLDAHICRWVYARINPPVIVLS